MRANKSSEPQLCFFSFTYYSTQDSYRFLSAVFAESIFDA